jgi:hypothetical protein
MSETELAQKLGISRKCLWERRQRFGIPRNKGSSGHIPASLRVAKTHRECATNSATTNAAIGNTPIRNRTIRNETPA